MIACAHCGTKFEPKNSRGRFCGAKCRAAAWQANRDQEISAALEELGRVTTRLERVRRRG